MGKTLEKRTWFTARQKKFLELVSQDKSFRTKFYLTGGTALSAVYFNHRESLDLDFFTPGEFSIGEIGNLVASTRQALGWIGISRDIKYPANTFLLKWEDRSNLKLDFNYYAFKQLKKGPKVFGLSVDSLEDLAANKLDTILTRRQARDYIDLYTIIKKSKLTLKRIINLHFKKFEMKVGYLAIAKSLLLAGEAEDYPLMRVKFNRKEMITFFENEAGKLKPLIFT